MLRSALVLVEPFLTTAELLGLADRLLDAHALNGEAANRLGHAVVARASCMSAMVRPNDPGN